MSVLVEKRGGYRVVTLNRPDRLNSFNAEMHGALMAALVEAEADTACRAVLLTGAGRGFSAGQDLSEVQPKPGEPPNLSVTIDRLYNPLVRKLRALPMPVVCAVNGIAAGAGANIALACDVVFAGRSAKFLQAFAKIALIPDSGGTWFLPRLAGDARARGMALIGEPISAETAESWGMIWKCVDDAALMDEAHALCARFAAAPTGALAAIKSALDAAASNTLDAQLDLERDVQHQLGLAHDYNEGVVAFMEKRAPQFRGRG